jgi:hypothetical protein
MAEKINEKLIRPPLPVEGEEAEEKGEIKDSPQ